MDDARSRPRVSQKEKKCLRVAAGGWLAVLLLALAPCAAHADEPGPMQKTGEKLDAWGHKVGQAVGKAAAKTGEALDKAAHKTGEKLDAWGHKIKQKLSD
jgi:hypothetical protein